MEARIVVFEFIEGFYNPHRRHSALDYESPVNYERRWDQVERKFTADHPDKLWVADIERHEALLNRVEMKGLRRGGCRGSPREAGGSLISET